MIIALTIALSLIALVVAVTSLWRQIDSEKITSDAVRDVRASVQALREAQTVRDAEAGLTPAQREDTIIR